MESPSETEAAAATAAVASMASTRTPASAASSTEVRAWFAWPDQFTIAQLMILTLVVGLAMTLLAMVRKHDRVEHIVAMVAFEIIALPALTMIVLLLTMAPGPNRLRTIVVLSLLPTLIAAAIVGLVFLVVILSEARDIALGDFRNTPIWIVVGCQLFFHMVLWRPLVCPSCRQRPLRLVNKNEVWTDVLGRVRAIYECKACGARSSRSSWQVFRKPQLLDSGEADRSTSMASSGVVPGSGSSSE